MKTLAKIMVIFSIFALGLGQECDCEEPVDVWFKVWLEQRFRTLASELEKRGQMNGVVAELTSVILKEIKKEKENEKLQKTN